MKKNLSNFEINILKAFISLPNNKLLEHKYEMDMDYLAGYVNRFLKGERFAQDFTAFTKDQSEMINTLITKNIINDVGKDLLTEYYLTKIVVNILNKYKK